MSGLPAPFVKTREIRIALVYVRQTSYSVSAAGLCEIFKYTSMRRITNESDVGHEATVVVIMGAGGDRVRRHLAVHVEISESRPGGDKTKKQTLLASHPKTCI